MLKDVCLQLLLQQNVLLCSLSAIKFPNYKKAQKNSLPFLKHAWRKWKKNTMKKKYRWSDYYYTILMKNFCILSEIHKIIASLKNKLYAFFLYIGCPIWIHSGPENLKRSRPKKLVKQKKKKINFFYQNPLSAISKIAKNQFLNWEKV